MLTEEFVRLHGGDPADAGDGVILLPDGAMVRHGFTALFDTLYDPPTDPRQRLRRRLEYAQRRYQDALDAEQIWHATMAGHSDGFRWDAAKLGPAPSAWDRLMRRDGRRKDWAAEAEVAERLKTIRAERKALIDALVEEGRQLELVLV